MSETDKDIFWLDCCENTARTSKAKRLQVGAVIVRGNAVNGVGVNHHPDNLPCEITDSFGNLVTDPRVVHAEIDALNSCRHSAKDNTIYVSHMPCPDCATAIIKSGIKRVVYRHEYRLKDGVILLKANGIEVCHIPPKANKIREFANRCDVCLILAVWAAIFATILTFGLSRRNTIASTDYDHEAIQRQHHQLIYIHDSIAQGFDHAPYCWCGKGIIDTEEN